MTGSDQGEFFLTVDGRYVFFRVYKENSMLNYFSRMT